MEHSVLTELVWLAPFGLLEPCEERLVRDHLVTDCATCRVIAIRAARLAALERREPRAAGSLAELRGRVLASFRKHRNDR